jgi:hypothetical protein
LLRASLWASAAGKAENASQELASGAHAASLSGDGASFDADRAERVQ